MKKTVFLIVILFVTDIFSQNETKLQEYLPPSPTAQEFIKYGEYPVGMYTGVPNISIPLYTISVKDIQVPIALSYHSSGIQVDQVASCVGLGWSLSTGGIISKIPRGKPDDTADGFLLSTVVESNNLVFDTQYYEDAATGVVDTESDVYYYNFAGFTGKFFFNRSKNIRLIDKAPIIISYASGNFKITTKEGDIYEFDERESSGAVTWSAGDPIGTSELHTSSWHLTKILPVNKLDTINFSYGSDTSFSTQQYNYSESTGNKINLTVCPPGIDSNVHDFGALVSQTQITNYPKRLNEITFNNGKVVFDRLTGREDIINERLQKINIYSKVDQNYYKIKEFEFVHGYFHSNDYSIVYSPTANPTESHRKRLKLTDLIEYDNLNNRSKKYTFGYNNTMLPPIETNAKDLWGYYNGENNNTTLIPLQEFQYLGNDVGSADREPDSLFMKAGVLNKITYPTGGYTEFTYEPHEYVTTENTLIQKTFDVFAVGQTGTIGDGILHLDSISITPNHAGFAIVSMEGSDMTDASGGSFATISLQESGSTSYIINHSIDPYTYSYPMNPPEVEKTFSPVWLEKNVTYTLKATVVGGSSTNEFSGSAYMKAEINYNEEDGVEVPITKIAGGLRIQQIKSYYKNNELAFSKKYEYTNATLITPEIFLKEQFLDTPIQVWNVCTLMENPSCLSSSTIRRFYYGGTVQSLTLNGGSPVIYGSVDEYIVDFQNNDTGKTNYTYDIQSDDILPVASSYIGGIMLLKKDWLGGQSKSTKIYSDDAIDENDFITSEVNDYTVKKYDDSYKMYKIVHTKRISGNCMNVYPSGDVENRFEIFEYPIYTGIKLLSSTEKITKYDSGSDLVTATNIFYDNDTHLQPTRTETTKSNGEIIITKTVYPDDIKTISTLQDDSVLEGGALDPDEFDAVERLQIDDLHQVVIPIQVEKYKKEGAIETLLSLQRTNFDNKGNDLILPESIQISKGTESLEPRLVYHDYDSYGNPLEVSKTDGTHVVYIWGYNHTNPIAKIENANQSELTQDQDIAITNAMTASDNDTSEALEDVLRQELNDLRDAFGNSQVTTYTYNPLIGVTSITDPSGYTSFYVYDDFNRLQYIKDKDEVVLKSYKYHYQGQPDSDPIVTYSVTNEIDGGVGNVSINPSDVESGSYSDITATPGSGYEIDYIKVGTTSYSFTNNTARIDNITADTEVHVKFKTLAVALSVNPTFLFFEDIDGNKTITITSSGSWTVSKSDSWIIISTTTGSGNDTFTIRPLKNLGSLRTGTVTVSDGSTSITISIEQLGDGGPL